MAESGWWITGQGSPSLNCGTIALTDTNLLKYYRRKWTWAKSCLIHLSGVANTVFSIVILLLAALQYKPKPYHKFLVSYRKSAFIGNSLFHALTHYKVFWQSKQPIKRIFWEGCGAKKCTTKHFLVYSQAEKMVPHPPFPVNPAQLVVHFALMSLTAEPSSSQQAQKVSVDGILCKGQNQAFLMGLFNSNHGCQGFILIVSHGRADQLQHRSCHV